MDEERWRRARALFEAVADTPRDRWESRLVELCPDDANIRREALELLVADSEAGAATDLGDRARGAVAAVAARDDAAWSERLEGARVGPYALEREIGRGGMGAVWLARRADGEFEQQVAIKLIRPGWDADGLIERFRAERQILAGLTHPNIAHLVDGGVTSEGRPWLALEYVAGTNLREHCDRQRAGLSDRLRLFLTVCEAVAHAHARLVVHRDLKPSNLLVTAGGQVKLLDFGIAKLVDPQATQVSALRVFTPEYAAPEQVRGELITTAVDVYALGLLLYELLTGRRPYHSENSTPAAYEQAILHQEPTRPSHAVSRRPPTAADPLSGADGAGAATAGAATAEELAARRQSTPENLRRMLRGDLDAIVLKALRKEPAQRYASVIELAADVSNYLARRPVQALRGGWRYRTRRFLSRHALATGLIALAVLSLVGGLGTALWQARETRRQRDAARAESAKSATMLQFMLDLFRGSDPAAEQRNDVTARELLERGVIRVRGQLASQPAARAELMQAMADAYTGIGLPKESEPLMREALAVRRQIGDPLELARALVAYAGLQHPGLEYTTSPESLDEADALLAGIQTSTSDPDRSREIRLVRARSQYMRGVAFHNASVTATDKQQRGEAAAKAEPFLREAAAVERELLGVDHPRTLESVIRLARTLALQEGFDESNRVLDELIATLRAVRPLPNSLLADAVDARGATYWIQRRFVEYEQSSREVVALTEAAHGPDALAVMYARYNLATALGYAGRYAESVSEIERAVRGTRVLLPPSHPFLLAALRRLGDSHAALAHWTAADEAYSEALAKSRAITEKTPRLQLEIAALEERLAAVRGGRMPAVVAKWLVSSPKPG